MIPVCGQIAIPEDEIEIRAMRASGQGGQNVNKVATAVQLRFDIRNSSLPERCKKRLLAMRDRRISKEGVVVIKAQSHRHQEQNRVAACRTSRWRVPTRPTQAAKRRRLENKRHRGKVKAWRGAVRGEES